MGNHRKATRSTFKRKYGLLASSVFGYLCWYRYTVLRSLNDGSSSYNPLMTFLDGGDTAMTAPIIVRGVHSNATVITNKADDPLPAAESAISLTGVAATNTKTTTRTGNLKEVVDFERQEGVVLAVKIQGMPKINQLIMLKQSLCLLKAAYNHRMNYDHIIFSTIPIPEKDAEELRQIVAPAKLTLLLHSNPNLQEVLASFTKEQQDSLVKKCKVNDISELDWLTKCDEEDHGRSAFAYSKFSSYCSTKTKQQTQSGLGLCSYSSIYQGQLLLTFTHRTFDLNFKMNDKLTDWQAEFRSKHIWKHPALKPYKYMLWLDADAMCTKVWEHDPIAYMIRNDLVIFFDNFPQGNARGPSIHDRIRRSFGTNLCGLELNKEEGYLESKVQDEPCDHKLINQIHGFFHITNLDFYRR